MAAKKKEENNDGVAVVDGTSVPQSAEAPTGAQPEADSGEKLLKVNPRLDTLAVTIPTGVDDDGNVEYEDFKQGVKYSLDPSYLDHKTTEGVEKFVEA